MKINIKAIIFDMGGVILRTCDESPREELAAKMGITIEQLKNEVFFSESAIKSEEGALDKYDHWRTLLSNHGFTNLKNVREYDEKFWAGDCLDSELVEFIHRLKNEYKLGMISNAFKGAREWIESHYQFMDLFDYTIFSYEINLRKPDPRIYHFVCQKLRVEPREAVFVDDLPSNVAGAKSAGLMGIQYCNKNQLANDLDEIFKRMNDPHVPGNEGLGQDFHE